MVLMEKPEVKKRLGRAWRRWEDSIKICLIEIGWEGGKSGRLL
jgi:hypothetical protein